ncbi:MAG: GNAT family N-acetyltransferase [Burkholderiales bacterium]|nr:GNAT family N-acetyltransferase [Burkholderiales bacterium]
MYPELHVAGAPWPTNPPTPPRGVYLVAYVDGLPVGCGALRPIDERVVEVRRMYVRRSVRRIGIARALLARLEQLARELGYATMRLDAGCRQRPAMSLYESCGFTRIAPFGEYRGDPTSVCHELALRAEWSDKPMSTRA